MEDTFSEDSVIVTEVEVNDPFIGIKDPFAQLIDQCRDGAIVGVHDNTTTTTVIKLLKMEF